jgi:Protein of unknown function (DUF2911)
MKRNTLLPAITLAVGLAITGGLNAQPNLALPQPSPTCTLKQRIGLTDIQIDYSRPSVKGRKIFGGVVPYGNVWRTGANGATKISFSTDVKLNGNEVPAGTYELFTIPGEDDWTIILSKSTDTNPFHYTNSLDLVRFQTPARPIGEQIETFTIEFTQVRDDSAALYLLWEHSLVPFRVETDAVSKLVPQIEAYFEAAGKKPANVCYRAATFYFDHDQDLKKALAWLNTGLEGQPSMAFELLNLKAQILAKQGDKDGAIAAAKKSSELALKAEGPNSGFIKMNDALLSKLQ